MGEEDDGKSLPWEETKYTKRSRQRKKRVDMESGKKCGVFIDAFCSFDATMADAHKVAERNLKEDGF